MKRGEMPAKQHDFTATEIKAGILVLVSLFILVGFLVAIRGCRPSDDEAKTFYSVFTDISGLNRGADVRFGGVQVGKVTNIEPDPNDRASIRVTAVVEGHVPVNHGSVATIEQVTLTTEKHLEISTGEVDKPLHESGDTIRSNVGGGLFDTPNLEGVTTRLETMLDGINALLGVGPDGGGAAVDFVEVLESLKATLDEGAAVARGAGRAIEDNRPAIDEIVTRLAALEKTANELMMQLNDLIEENRPSIHQSFGNLEELTGELNRRVDELVATLQTTLVYLQDLGGNSSDLIDDQRPTIEEMLLNLEETTRNLKEFSRILADRPDALIRGKGRQGRENGDSK
jgi:phospholipid/cholesterol/gamma-HCH transport system substrate-binding protein